MCKVMVSVGFHQGGVLRCLEGKEYEKLWDTSERKASRSRSLNFALKRELVEEG